MTLQEEVEIIRRAFLDSRSFPDAPMSKSMKGALIGAMNRACGGNENRHLVLKFLTGQTSSKELMEDEWIALQKFVDLSQAGLQWLPRIELGNDCRKILESQTHQNGQLDLFADRKKDNGAGSDSDPKKK